MKSYKYLAILLLLLVTPLALLASEWRSFITPQKLQDITTTANGVVVIDARSSEEYAKGHIPGAISLPGADWRTGQVEPGAGDSQYIFRTANGQPDVARYEQLLGNAGVSESKTVVVYGNHAGKADGSVPALILEWLGHRDVRFLDGQGFVEWQKAGFKTETSPTSLKPTEYHATPKADFVWSLKEVLSNLENPAVLFYDTRSIHEYEGKDLRTNRFGGRIPGAVLIDYAEFLDGETKRVKSPEEVSAILAQKHITADKQIVLYCQTATRVSLPALALKDLGYARVPIYDASWHEYGNLDSTPIEGKVGKS